MVKTSELSATLYPFQSHILDITGMRYHYLDEGSGRPILMVHGNPSWSFLFRNLVREFRTDHRVVVPDHLGCGLSDKPSDFPYCLESHIQNLEQLVEHLDLRNITLVMHDWGGAIGMGLTIRQPERINSLIILNSSAFSMKRIPFRIDILRLPVLGDILVRRLNLFCRAACRMTTVKPLELDVRNAYLLPYGSYADRIAVLRFIQDIPMNPEDPSFPLLIEIEHGLWQMRENPIAIVWGMKDWCFTPQFLERWRTYYPGADVLTLENAGHYVLEDAESEAISFLRKFLSKNQL